MHFPSKNNNAAKWAISHKLTVKLLLKKSQKSWLKIVYMENLKTILPLQTILIFHGKSYTETHRWGNANTYPASNKSGVPDHLARSETCTFFGRRFSAEAEEPKKIKKAMTKRMRRQENETLTLDPRRISISIFCFQVRSILRWSNQWRWRDFISWI